MSLSKLKLKFLDWNQRMLINQQKSKIGHMPFHYYLNNAGIKTETIN